MNHITLASYDASANRTSVTDALNAVTRTTYNAFNKPEQITDALGVTTTYGYDCTPANTCTPGNGPAGYNLVKISTPLLDAGGNTIATQATAYRYRENDPNPGDVTSIVDPVGQVSGFGYDAFGDLTASTDADNHKTTATFDNAGRKTSQVSGRGNAPSAIAAQFTTTFAYDADNLVIQISEALSGHVTQRHYDANRNLDYTIDGDQNKTTYAYDAANERTTVGRPGAPPTTVRDSYWDNGRLHQHFDGANAPTTYTYDSVGRLATTADPLSRVTTYGYDGTGNLITQADPGGHCGASPLGCTTRGYDAANQLKTVTYSDGVTPNVTDTIYDADGQRQSMTDGTGTSTWSWDSLHRLTASVTGAASPGGAQAVGYGYDLANHTTSVTYPGPVTVTRHFDPAGNLDWVRDWSANTTNF
ncbi:MAG: hypothetical protein LC708_03430, partial [Actinobacteria bacterium]|nr:hypothetical protein [Actinomycetota bacterium]